MRPRADAARNAARLIAAARDAFLAGGDKVPLERIATIAGVGIGTLYRHFPGRDHLAEAVYRSELDELIAGVPELISKTSALEALQIWLSRYSQLIFTKRAMHDALRDTLMSREASTSVTWKRIDGALASFISAGSVDGSIRDDVRSDDLAVVLSGVVAAASFSADIEQLRRLLAIVATGVRRSTTD
ncbi:AcrR family transcriptional regulator [Neorhizobium galegae]|uniref:TetR/AcrR family transcriptional regulator n=1 Tax=Neorhizobium galegae TaxID=399 RepID=UPI00277EAA3A|nr:TetR/AcrR family transcriptional regulator [Neorhizobium galegae]MDQ0137546.1 AcrR family transcriptional regulator [Neorhizobium galegae]